MYIYVKKSGCVENKQVQVSILATTMESIQHAVSQDNVKSSSQWYHALKHLYCIIRVHHIEILVESAIKYQPPHIIRHLYLRNGKSYDHHSCADW